MPALSALLRPLLYVASFAALALLLLSDPFTAERDAPAAAPGRTAAVPQAGPREATRARPRPAAPRAVDGGPPPAPEDPAVARTVSVTGRVDSSAGAALAGIEIEIAPLGLRGEEIVTQTSHSDVYGEFRFDHILPGHEYRLVIAPQADHGGYRIESFTAEDALLLREIELEPVNLVDIDGMIVDTNRAPVPDFELEVHSLDARFPERRIVSDGSGYFRLAGFPAGEIRIATSHADYYRIKGIALQPDVYRNLTLVIDRGNHHLSGRVSDENGSPLARARVTLKSAFSGEGYHSYSYRSRLTDASGAFEFADLGSHEKTLGVYATGFESHLQRHAFRSFADHLDIRLRVAGDEPAG